MAVTCEHCHPCSPHPLQPPRGLQGFAVQLSFNREGSKQLQFPWEQPGAAKGNLPGNNWDIGGKVQEAVLGRFKCLWSPHQPQGPQLLSPSEETVWFGFGLKTIYWLLSILTNPRVIFIFFCLRGINWYCLTLQGLFMPHFLTGSHTRRADTLWL